MKKEKSKFQFGKALNGFICSLLLSIGILGKIFSESEINIIFSQVLTDIYYKAVEH